MQIPWDQVALGAIVIVGAAVIIVPLFRWRQRPRADDSEDEPAAPVTPAIQRMAGGAIAFAAFIISLAAAMLIVEQLTDQTTAGRFGAYFTYAGFGVAYIGWQWPAVFLRPFELAWRLITRR